jgi:hypothetical protein
VTGASRVRFCGLSANIRQIEGCEPGSSEGRDTEPSIDGRAVWK